MYVRGGEFHNSGFPTLEGFICFRIKMDTYWATDGFANTLFVYGQSGQRLNPYQYTGTWPPSSATLQAAGVSLQTHYIVRAA